MSVRVICNIEGFFKVNLLFELERGNFDVCNVNYGIEERVR